jgi:ABC-type lipoprotein release transport system permease subunit
MALGATRADVARLVMGHACALIALGLVAGVAGSLALSQVLNTQLYEVSARDPGTIATTALALAAVALMAAWVPTRRATSLDPVVTLRAE